LILIKKAIFFLFFILSWIVITNIVIGLDYSIYINGHIPFENITLKDNLLENIDYFYLLQNEYVNGDMFIFFIYLVLMIVYFAVIIGMIIDKIDFYKLLDFALNASPMLGLLGTLYAFSILVSGSSATNVSTLLSIFKLNFASAVTTTLLGGTTYVLLLFSELVSLKNEKD